MAFGLPCSSAHVAQLAALKRFVGAVPPEDLAPCAANGAPVACRAPKGVRLHVLYSERAACLYAWLYAPGRAAPIRISGLRPGTYALTWYDTWQGKHVAERELRVGKNTAAVVDPTAVLARLRAAAKPFPSQTRLAQGDDVAFKLVIRRSAE